MTTVTQPRHELIYAEPRAYDIGFCNRDFPVECGFLEYLSRNLGRGRLDSYVEVCCGPGHHLRTLASQGVRAYGIDISPEMVAYVEEHAGVSGQLPPEVPTAGPGAGGQAWIQLADPRDFTLPEAVDLAFCPSHHFRYLLRNEEVISHLVAVARNLGRGALYVLEMEHPRVLFEGGVYEPEAWVCERDQMKVAVTVGPGKGAIDPITQIRDLEIRLAITEPAGTRTVRDAAPVRAFTYPELRALVKLSGVFDWVATFGDLSITQPFDNTDGARCMVPVLRCSM